jgi:hypothetical protein
MAKRHAERIISEDARVGLTLSAPLGIKRALIARRKSEDYLSAAFAELLDPTERREAIRAMFEYGLGGTKIAELTGLSRSRVHQLRDVEEVAVCSCTNEQLEAGSHCADPACPGRSS